MKSINVNGIKVNYTDNYEKDIDRIVNLIGRYSFLFLSFGYSSLIFDNTDGIDKHGFHIKDFDSFFDNFFTSLVNDVDFTSLLNDDAIPFLYYTKLVKNKGNEDSSFFEPDVCNENLLYLVASLKRYKLPEQIKEFCSFLKTSDEEVFNFLKENERYNIYNFLTKTALDSLKINDSSFYENLQNIFIKFFQETSSRNTSAYEYSDSSLDKIVYDDFIKLFMEFLDYVGASKWKDDFMNLLNENRIIFEEMEEDNRSEYFKDVDGITKIRVSNDGSLSSFTSLAHEFAHYISCENKKPLFLLLEFPSIYFENVAADFLSKKGYGDSAIKNVLYSRQEDNEAIFLFLFPLFIDFIIYLKEGKITPEISYKYFKNSDDKSSNKEDDKPSESEFSSFKKALDDNIDTKINFYIENGTFFFDGCQYLLGTMLAYKTLDNYDDKTNKSMVHITENLDKLDTSVIITCLNDNPTLDNQNVKKKKR